MYNQYFKKKEFYCKCGKCVSPEMPAKLIEVLSDVREHYGKPLIVNSAYRCPTHNKAVGGAPESQHVLGTAADIKVKGVSPDEVHAYLTRKYPDSLGIGKYNTFTHVDVRPNKARW